MAGEQLAGDGEDRADAHLVYRSVTAIMAEALRSHNRALFSEGIESLVQIYRIGDMKAMLPITTPNFEASLRLSRKAPA